MVAFGFLPNNSIGGSKRGVSDTCAPGGSKFFQFHAVLGKFWQNCMLVPPVGLAALPWGNSGSTTE